GLSESSSSGLCGIRIVAAEYDGRRAGGRPTVCQAGFSTGVRAQNLESCGCRSDSIWNSGGRWSHGWLSADQTRYSGNQQKERPEALDNAHYVPGFRTHDWRFDYSAYLVNSSKGFRRQG